MQAKSKFFPGAHFEQEQPRVIERHGDNTLVVHDTPAGPLPKTLPWLAAGAIPVIAVLGVLAPQDIAGAAMVGLMAFASIVLMARRTRAGIDLADRKITITREFFTLEKQKVYTLDDFTAVEIQARPRLVEGYSLPFFVVRLVGRGKPIILYSTDDPDEAEAVQKELSGFLEKAGISTPQHQSG